MNRIANAPSPSPLSDTERAEARNASRQTMATAVWSLWRELSARNGWDQQWLAERLGRDKSRVSRLLNNPGNWTLDTIADLLAAMGARLSDVKLSHDWDLSEAPAEQVARRVRWA